MLVYPGGRNISMYHTTQFSRSIELQISTDFSLKQKKALIKSGLS